MAMTVLDSSIANVALPVIARDLGTSPIASIWIVNSYQLAIVMTLFIFAAIGEIAGYRPVYLLGLFIFIMASAKCALSDHLPALVVARFVQGLGAAAIMSVNGALVRFTFPAGHLGRAMGYNAVVIAISATVAPMVAGTVLSLVSWRWLFGINLLFGLLALAAGYRCLPDARGRWRLFDLRSAALSALSLSGLFLGMSVTAQHGVGPWSLAGVVLFLTAGAIAIGRANQQDQPLIPIDLTRMPVLRNAYAASLCTFAAQMIVMVSLPFYLHLNFRLSPWETGLIMTPIPLGLALLAPLAGRLSDHASHALIGGAGLCLSAAGFIAFAVLPAFLPLRATLIMCGFLCGAGFGLFQAPNNRKMIGAAPRERSGAAAGMLAVSRLAGQTAGAMMAAFLIRHNGTASNAFFYVAAALALLGALLTPATVQRLAR
ncbi:MFS transporter [Aquisediminimonas sediminicola]|uniref:MFS transporter n=1 Tax=Alteraquisediminimonas sediminicola TaxID=2676787 RepID=UPI001C8EB517|nr:MFS transporter [Aquisediminimonas sediminicola]